MQNHSPSPRVVELAWGMIAVADEQVGSRTFKDVKLYPGGSRVWDWRETGTRHRPGIQPADVLDLIDAGPEVVILSRGVHRRLEVMPRTVQLLEQSGITVRVLQTEEAVAAYNALVDEGRRVAALIHSTC